MIFYFGVLWQCCDSLIFFSQNKKHFDNSGKSHSCFSGHLWWWFVTNLFDRTPMIRIQVYAVRVAFRCKCFMSIEAAEKSNRFRRVNPLFQPMWDSRTWVICLTYMRSIFHVLLFATCNVTHKLMTSLSKQSISIIELHRFNKVFFQF